MKAFSLSWLSKLSDKILPEGCKEGNPLVYFEKKQQAENVTCISIVLTHYQISPVLKWKVGIRL